MKNTPSTSSNPAISYFSYKKINSIIRLLTMFDLLIAGGFGLIAPIFAIYIFESIPGAGVTVIGISSTIFLLTKSLMQVPVGILIDRWKGERDDFLFLVVGGSIFALVPILYIFVDSIWALYFVQFLYGCAAAFSYPSWMALFTRHVDKEHEGIEWSIYATMVEMGMAVTAALGGFIADKFGFKVLFIAASASIFIANIFILSLFRKFIKKT